MPGHPPRTYSYGRSADQVLDLYLPDEVDATTPVFVNVHGGAWFTGDKALCEGSSLELARRGVAVVNTNYRLGASDPVKTMVPDLWAALDWVSRAEGPVASAIGRRAPASVFLGGDSAGAHLALLSAAALVNPELGRLWPLQVRRPGGTHLAGLVFYSGALDLSRLAVTSDHTHSERFAGYRTTLAGGRTGTRASEHLRLIDPAQWLARRLPPMLAFSSSIDFFHESTVSYLDRARTSSQAVTLVNFDDSHPACTHSWQLDPSLPESQATYDSTAEFLHSATAKRQAGQRAASAPS